ncbi:hypothetical protein DITRI_Ditri18aG0015400 [Diplodiscus trichospermus]
MAFSLFIGGVIKYAKRIWALRCASKKQLITYFYTSSTSKNPNECNAFDQKTIRIGLPVLPEKKDFVRDPSMAPEVKFLWELNSSFDIFKPLFTDLQFQISPEFHDEMVYLKSRSADKAFNFVKIELEFLYDLLFTKNPIRHRLYLFNLILRGLCILSVVSVLIALSVLRNKLEHSTIDTAVTYVLLSGAIYLEIFSSYMHYRSKWTVLKYATSQTKIHKLYHWFVDKKLRSITLKKGIRKMPQHDLIDYFVKAKANRLTPVIKLIDITNLLQRFGNTKLKPVDTELKEFIFCHLKEKHSKNEKERFKLDYLENLLGKKGHNVIEEKDLSLQDEYWKVESTYFTRRIFV